jgi:CMP-N,N'-diacetyllegionaminic acid synthase
MKTLTLRSITSSGGAAMLYNRFGLAEILSMKPKIIAIIPARGGSKGLPGKNVRELNGKPLIYYTIREALESKFLDRIIVSTEDKEIMELARAYGAEVIIRPVELAMDDTPSLPVFQHTIQYLEEVKDYHPDVIVILQPTSPLRTVDDIDGAIRKFLETDCDSVVSVCKVEHPPHWTYFLKGDRLEPVIKGGEKITRRQDAPEVYRSSGAVYVTHRDVIMKQNRIWGNDTRAFIIPPERSIDIDTEVDLKVAEVLIKEMECKKIEPPER